MAWSPNEFVTSKVNAPENIEAGEIMHPENEEIDDVIETITVTEDVIEPL